MSDFVQGIRYGLMAFGWLVSFGAGVVGLCVIGAMFTAISDWVNGEGKKND